ncbi:hypothetical protein SLS60_005503 [Paraconiothyrium brasiliense]|uniref:Uncharacterized protein n=1 Tax=Paraconiothyrium brasiliense TaxID=300254 RepID=A0ABR3RHI4_9PLEO
MRDTLLGYLRQKNPIIQNRPKKSERWEGFDPDIVHNMYSDILCRIRERAPVELDLESIDLRIRKEREMHNIVAGWNKKVIFKAMEETGQYMGRNDLLVMVPGEKAIDPQGPKRSYEPDWAAITLDSYKDTVGDLTNNFLPGDTKCSKNWKPEEKKDESNADSSFIQQRTKCIFLLAFLCDISSEQISKKKVRQEAFCG